jgi:uncharacterized membrane protein YphA (DoxX/SURF4 family)
MPAEARKKVLVLFLVLAVLFALAGILTFMHTGEMGIEERFAKATGLGNGDLGDAGGEETPAGIPIEGNLAGYMAVVAVLLIASGILALRKPR